MNWGVIRIKFLFVVLSVENNLILIFKIDCVYILLFRVVKEMNFDCVFIVVFYYFLDGVCW